MDRQIDGRSIDGLCEPRLRALVRSHRAVFIISSSGFLTSCFVSYKFSTGLNLLSVINDLSQSF